MSLYFTRAACGRIYKAAEKLGYSELHQKQKSQGEVQSFLNGTELFER